VNHFPKSVHSSNILDKTLWELTCVDTFEFHCVAVVMGYCASMFHQEHVTLWCSQRVKLTDRSLLCHRMATRHWVSPSNRWSKHLSNLRNISLSHQPSIPQTLICSEFNFGSCIRNESNDSYQKIVCTERTPVESFK
jgi:hypothetical protein